MHAHLLSAAYQSLSCLVIIYTSFYLFKLPQRHFDKQHTHCFVEIIMRQAGLRSIDANQPIIYQKRLTS